MRKNVVVGFAVGLLVGVGVAFTVAGYLVHGAVKARDAAERRQREAEERHRVLETEIATALAAELRSAAEANGALVDATRAAGKK